MEKKVQLLIKSSEGGIVYDFIVMHILDDGDYILLINERIVLATFDAEKNTLRVSDPIETYNVEKPHTAYIGTTETS